MYLMHETYTILKKELVPKGSPVYGKHIDLRCTSHLIGLSEDDVIMYKLRFPKPWCLLTREQASRWIDPKYGHFDTGVVYPFE